MDGRKFQTGANLFFLVLVSCAVYANTLSVPFLYDDYACVVNNPAVQNVRLLADTDLLDSIDMIPDLKNNVKTRTFSYLTFAANYAAHGFDLTGYHVVNIAIHAANACLVYLLFYLVMGLARPSTPRAPEDSAHFAKIALAGALLFAVHPVNTSAVTYITQRFTSLVTFLYLMAVISYIKARCSESSRSRWCFYIAGLLATVLAMDTNETAFTIPMTITIVELIFLRAAILWRAVVLLPFYATMTIIPITLYTIPSSSSDLLMLLSEKIELMNLDDIPRLSYLFTQFRVIMTYIRLMLCPVHLNLDYDYPIYHSFTEPPVFLSFFFLVILAALGFYLAVRGRNLQDENSPGCLVAAFGIFWFFATLSMSSSIIPINDVINEYRLYLPGIGFILFVISLLEGGIKHQHHLKVTATVAGAIVVVALAVTTVSRNVVWQDSVSLWKDVVGKSPNKLRPAKNLSDQYLWLNKPDQAIRTLKNLIERNPTLGRPHYFLGSAYLQLERPGEAIVEFEKARDIKEDKAEIFIGLAKANFALGQTAAAMEYLRIAMLLEPQNRELAHLLNEFPPQVLREQASTLDPGGQGSM